MNLNISGVLGSTFVDSSGLKLLIERDLGDGLLHVIRLPSGATHRVENPETGELQLTDFPWFERNLAEGELRKIADRNGPVAPARAQARVFDREYILEKDPMAEARLKLILGLVERGVDASDARLGAEIKKIWTGDLEERFGTCPTIPKVRSWLGRIIDTDITLEQMFSLSGRVARQNRLASQIEQIIQEERPRYWANRGYKIIDVEAAVVTRVHQLNIRRVAEGVDPLPVPGKETIRRRVNEMLCRETYAAKFGEKAAKRKFDGSGRGITATRILQIALMDDTIVDLVTCLDVDRGLIAGRPYLTVILDVHSRCVIGLTVSFLPPNSQKAADTVRKALLPERFRAISAQCLRTANFAKFDVRPDRLARFPALAYLSGKPDKIVTDNGANYVAPAFGELLADLGITHELAPVGSPRHKGIIERFFRTLNTFLIDKLPGATLDPSVLRKLGIDPGSEAVVTVTELKELIADFLFAYHTNFHSGISAVPLQKWERGMTAGHRQMILDRRKIDIVTGTTVHNKRITVGGGARMFGLTWKGPNLPVVTDKLAAKEPHRKRLDATAAITTKIKYNPEDLLRVQVFVGDDWLDLENTQPEYADGLSLWQHNQIRDFAKREALKFSSQAERLAARYELNKAIQEAFPDADARERRAMARMLGGSPGASAAFPVEYAEAEPRHDGMAPIIEHEAPANEREDALRAQSRPGFSTSAELDADAEGGEDPEASFDAAGLTFHMPPPIVEPTSNDDDFEEFK
ncbi:DDE-type integrase/transposase/recombinase [Sphingomonas sp. S2-65]|uniref:DDE-type integrase/transposase/recombinase n=1 Tax=Sphingomonas sp. S2-65 TaxID=2903960 RepID=UPI001F260077|nr:DDE-type integrase/transposase/recombinase [Sphingomonas sp. S2-65]UYY58000.1 DDE-type integrase/transposase/recombinase [Sphingomonas sp. S2-65]